MLPQKKEPITPSIVSNGPNPIAIPWQLDNVPNLIASKPLPSLWYPQVSIFSGHA